jgi:hypothetical protein
MSDPEHTAIRVRNLSSGDVEVCFGTTCITVECKAAQPLPTPYGTAFLKDPEAVRSALQDLNEGEPLVVGHAYAERVELDEYRHAADIAASLGHELVIEVTRGDTHHG